MEADGLAAAESGTNRRTATGGERVEPVSLNNRRFKADNEEKGFGERRDKSQWRMIDQPARNQRNRAMMGRRRGIAMQRMVERRRGAEKLERQKKEEHQAGRKGFASRPWGGQRFQARTHADDQ